VGWWSRFQRLKAASLVSVEKKWQRRRFNVAVAKYTLPKSISGLNHQQATSCIIMGRYLCEFFSNYIHVAASAYFFDYQIMVFSIPSKQLPHLVPLIMGFNYFPATTRWVFLLAAKNPISCFTN